MLTRTAPSVNRFTGRVLPPVALAALLTALATVAPALAEAPVAGQSINMVSGKTLPGGDPFLQRQNEPSLAVSSRNPRHLLAGANDYRTVDIPGLPDGTETGDSWLGLFKSFDAGETWQSTLIPGYPQDTTAAGLASPLHGYTAGADPVVRAGTHGLFYYSGIVFNRGTNQSRLHVSTFLDLNNKENGSVAAARDPIQFAGTVAVSTGNSGQFLDKPWIAVDIPRAGARTRTFNLGGVSQTVSCGSVYLAWSEFVGSQASKILLSKSVDCGLTWSKGTKVSEGNLVNQGAVVTVAPDGTVFVAWRRFASSSEGDAILFVKSTDCGDKFSKPAAIAPAAGGTFFPFDQASDPVQPTQTAFRTNAYPTIAASGNSRVHVAWAQRPTPGGFARIVMATSTNGGTTWAAATPVDNAPLTDDFGATFDRGHQFMPQLTFSAGRLVLIYYDTRLDHTAGVYDEGPAFANDGQGAFYLEERAPKGELELVGGEDAVFTPRVDDAGLSLRRHTIDVRVSQVNLCAASAVTTTRVSQFPFGIADPIATTQPANPFEQLTFNPPNLPLFGKGKVPFVGDYIDVAGSAFMANPGGTSWSFNTACATAPVFHAVWTSNQDVRPPADGDWTKYTPVGGGGTSYFDPTQTSPACDPGAPDRAGMRNQNIYSSRLTEGLIVSSPQNAKPLKPFVPGNAASVRAFVVLAQNLMDTQRTFRLHIANQPVGGKSSFIKWDLSGDPVEDLYVEIGPRSGISRPVFATSSNPKATVRVEVDETTGVNGTVVPGGLSGFVVLNADASGVPLADPDGGPAGVNTVEIYTPSVSNPSVYNPSVSNPSVSNPSVSNPSVLNPSVYNPSVSNPSVLNPSVSNPSVLNPSVSNPSVLNPSVSNSSVLNTPISDASYAVTNNGNTSASYRVQLVGDPTVALGGLQLLVTKNQVTPTSAACQLVEQAQSTVLVNIANPPIVVPSTTLGPALDDSRETNATFSLRPGETGYVTLRGQYGLADMRQIAASVAPAVISHPSDPLLAPDYAAPLAITSDSTLPGATFGAVYNASLEAFGGKAPYSWTSSGLPAGLSVAGGLVSGTPQQAGTFTPTVVVTDGNLTTVTRSFSLEVAKVTPMVSWANPPGIVYGTALGGAQLNATSSVAGTFSYTPPAGTILNTGSHTLSVTFTPSDANNYNSTSATVSLAVSKATPVVSWSNPPGIVYGTALSGTQLNATSDAAGTFSYTPPAGTILNAGSQTLSVSFTPSDGTNYDVGSATVSLAVSKATPVVTWASPAAIAYGTALSGTQLNATSSVAGTFSYTPPAGTILNPGSQTLSVSFAPNDTSDYVSASATASLTVAKAATASALAASPNPSSFGQSVTFTATVTGPVGTPTGTVTFKDGLATLGTGALNASGVATFATSSLAVGSHTITAAYNGDSSLLASTGPPVVQAVISVATTTTLTSSANPSAFCRTVTFTANVTGPGGAGAPTGTVTFKDGSTTLKTVTLTAGVATFATSTLSLGTHSITAIYGGGGSLAGSTSAVLTQTVGKASTSTALTSSLNPSVFCQKVIFTATVTLQAGTGVPTGSVTFKKGSTTLGTGALSAFGVATFATTTLPRGSYSITAVYAGSTNFNGSTSAPLTQQVN